MNAPPKIDVATPLPFAGAPQTPAEHFSLALFSVIGHLIDICCEQDRDAAFEVHPFLLVYAEEMERRLGRQKPSAQEWRDAVAAWEAALPAGSPLAALKEAGLTALELDLVLAAGLIEEDPRFCDLYERAAGERRPILALLVAWWRTWQDGEDNADAVRRSIARLVRMGLLQVLNPLAPRSEWALAVPSVLWDALRGETPDAPWLDFRTTHSLPPLDRYVATPEVASICRRLPALLARAPRTLLTIRGPNRNGRTTLLGGVARALNLGLLVAGDEVLADEARWRIFGVLSVMLRALPVLRLGLLPGETRLLPALPPIVGPLAVVTGSGGTVECQEGRPTITVSLPLPAASHRIRLWKTAAANQPADALEMLARSTRMSSGNIQRAASAASGYAALDDRKAISQDDVRQACRGLHGARLEKVATRLEGGGTLDDISLEDLTRDEIRALLARCRHREALATPAEGGCGVRALFSGPSGTGKTFAARLVASALGKDLYRVDLSTAVSKYLGETEKNLDQAFCAAEELDVVMLLDEGDALMASRTDVGSSNDRYANLETNFLLQRIEAFSGILLITTNAVDRIDKAFSRRMDVVIPFGMPDDVRRYEILRLQLGDQRIDDAFLQDLACRCVLSGGQLRNVALHARLLALDAEEVLAERHLRAAVTREYRKTGSHSPLKTGNPGWEA